MKNVLVAQSGGPTVAINSSLLGIYEKAKLVGVEKVYGACFGLSGLLDKKIVDLDLVFDGVDRNLLMQTPASFLGSCRKKIPFFYDETEQSSSIYYEIYKIFKALNIGSFFYIGGNDSMDTVFKISAYFKSIGEPINVIGVPKTIDNDLCETDHCPGFGSAAKFVATTFLELERDCSVYCLPAVTIVEVMGRDAGWLTAASVLSRLNGASGPNLIYCCEQKFSVDQFLDDIKQQFVSGTGGSVLVAISEGLELEQTVCERQENWFDEFCHAKNAGVAKVLEKIVSNRLGCKVRSIELSLLQRCCAHLSSLVDLQESKQIGQKAVELACDGLTGVMVVIKRKGNDPYEVEFDYVSVEKVASKVKKMPDYMLKGRFDISDEAISYLKPLVQGNLEMKIENVLPVHLHLRPRFVEF